MAGPVVEIVGVDEGLVDHEAVFGEVGVAGVVTAKSRLEKPGGVVKSGHERVSYFFARAETAGAARADRRAASRRT